MNKTNVLSLILVPEKKYECLDSHDIHPITMKKYIAQGYNQALSDIISLNSGRVVSEEKLAKICHENSGASRGFCKKYSDMSESDKEVFRREANKIISNLPELLVKVEKGE